VDQAGWQVHVSNTTAGARGVLRHVSEEGKVTVCDMLPPHPKPGYEDSANPRCILPASVAQLVTERMQLPCGADRDTVYVQTAHTSGGGRDPIVRVVWFTPEAADVITGSCTGTHAETAGELHQLRYQISDRQAVHSSVNVQPTRGPYVELGVGCLPGGGRQTVRVGGSSCVVPFPRNVQLSTAVEPCLTQFMSDVSHVLHHVLPAATMQAHASPIGCPEEASRAYQYPRLRVDAPPLRSHQVVLRGSIPDVQTGMDADEQALHALSDLHTDPWDGGGDLGSCTVYVCSEARKGVHGSPSLSREEELLAHRGVAVFPSHCGGRGVHVCSVVPGWHCAVLTKTASRLHGAVFMAKLDASGFALPQYDIARVVTYPIARIETLLQRLSDNPECLHCVREKSHPWLHARMV